MEPNALKVQKVYPKLTRTFISAMTSVKGVYSSLKPLMIVSTASPASAEVSAYSMLMRMLLPRCRWYRSSSAKQPPKIMTDSRMRP